MRKAIVAGGIAVVAVFAGVLYVAKDSAEPPAAAAASKDAGARAETAVLAADAPVPSTTRNVMAPPRRVPADPRLAALGVSPDNGLIEFVAGPDGKVIKEIDKDPSSPGFKKPLREYTYAGDQVVGLTSYKYLGDQVQIIKTAVSYKPDGSVDKYVESTSYEHGKK